MLGLSPKLKEMLQRQSLVMHFGDAGELTDQILAGFHLDDAVYGPLYFDYGGQDEPQGGPRPGTCAGGDDGHIAVGQVFSGAIPDGAHALLDRLVLGVDPLDAGEGLVLLHFPVDHPIVGTVLDGPEIREHIVRTPAHP